MSKRVLIVDDSPMITALLSLSLSQAGYHVDVAESGARALDMVEAFQPDLMLLDIDMPEVNGLDVLSAVKRRALQPAMPVIMLTGVDDPFYVGQAHRMGAAGFFAKPFDVDRLLRQLDRVLVDADTLWIDDHHAVTRRRSPARAAMH